MAYVNDELIENLRKAMERSVMTGSPLELLSAASEIVEGAGKPRAFRDRDYDVWYEHPGHWCLLRDCDAPRKLADDDGHGCTLERITGLYGPLTSVDDERN